MTDLTKRHDHEEPPEALEPYHKLRNEINKK